jgi:hypothetical protein
MMPSTYGDAVMSIQQHQLDLCFPSKFSVEGPPVVQQLGGKRMSVRRSSHCSCTCRRTYAEKPCLKRIMIYPRLGLYPSARIITIHSEARNDFHFVDVNDDIFHLTSGSCGTEINRSSHLSKSVMFMDFSIFNSKTLVKNSTTY